MPIEVFEKWDSRESTISENSSIDLRFLIRGTADDAEARNALVAASPVLYGGLVRQSAHTERIAEEAWEGTVRYGVQEPKQVGDSTFSFDTGGGTQHVTQALATVGAYAASGPAPNFRGAIGATPDGVEGVDITVPVYNFAETHYIAADLVTEGYKSTLFHLTGTINNGIFRGFNTGEVLFLGASGSKRGPEDWEISYRFAASPNVSGLVVGDIGGITKRGWDYLWVRYEDAEDTAARVLVKRPVGVYVEQVYPMGNFGGLGI
ncbi:hypothetical protein SH661x_004354 [Planctomicrobium sp. SH661]|uniref:hypothetical protein n=1 Tax=Planctomicrobium sp. SH661 TaxID=3448124 RepID=UPI003F5B16FA